MNITDLVAASLGDGLSAQEAAGRLAADGPNELPTTTRRNLLQEAWGVVRQPMLLLRLSAGAVIDRSIESGPAVRELRAAKAANGTKSSRTFRVLLHRRQ